MSYYSNLYSNTYSEAQTYKNEAGQIYLLKNRIEFLELQIKGLTTGSGTAVYQGNRRVTQGATGTLIAQGHSYEYVRYYGSSYGSGMLVHINRY